MAFMRVFGAMLADTLGKSTPHLSRATCVGHGARAHVSVSPSRRARVSVCCHLSLARVAGSRGDSRGGRRGESAERETTHSTHSARRPEQAGAAVYTVRTYPLCTDDFGSLSRKMPLPAKCSPVNVNSQAALRTIN